FFYAELTYTLENFDSLLFARFHRVDSAEKPAGRLEQALFAEPNRLFRRYAHHYAAGQAIFARGDEDRSALYLYRGQVDIYLARPGDAESASVSSVTEGEFFGEMAWILEEPRSAWAVAATECVVFVLPPSLFERFLTHDASASRRLVELLAARLKANNDLLAKAGLR
ncbi:MAG: cyclic nucleotide-binding domain-containing protein, partial [Spirochaetales bacterium]|nr:cyclic nucleotide-binding domain-containing protein [Spirochaetales bacterium]